VRRKESSTGTPHCTGHGSPVHTLRPDETT
jgi:hypothetical protein